MCEEEERGRGGEGEEKGRKTCLKTDVLSLFIAVQPQHQVIHSLSLHRHRDGITVGVCVSINYLSLRSLESEVFASLASILSSLSQHQINRPDGTLHTD